MKNPVLLNLELKCRNNDTNLVDDNLRHTQRVLSLAEFNCLDDDDRKRKNLPDLSFSLSTQQKVEAENLHKKLRREAFKPKPP